MPVKLESRTLAITLAALVCAIVPAAAHEYNGKAVNVAHPWARATPGSSTVGAAYVEITGAKDAQGDKLIGASAPVAGRIEVHTHLMEEGVMKMRKAEAVAVTAGEVRKLAPGGDHLMMFDLKSPLKEGEVFPLTLKFETSGEITVDAVIESAGAMGPHGIGAAAPADANTSTEGSNDGSHAGSHDGH